MEGTNSVYERGLGPTTHQMSNLDIFWTGPKRLLHAVQEGLDTTVGALERRRVVGMAT
jgi:hypothetical protein